MSFGIRYGAVVADGFIENGAWVNSGREIPVTDINIFYIKYSKNYEEYRFILLTNGRRIEVPLATKNVHRAYEHFWQMTRYLEDGFPDMFVCVNNNCCFNLAKVKSYDLTENGTKLTANFDGCHIDINPQFIRRVIQTNRAYSNSAKTPKNDITGKDSEMLVSSF